MTSKKEIPPENPRRSQDVVEENNDLAVLSNIHQLNYG